MSLLDKMMRIAGRGDDGTAKAISTTNDGAVKTQLTGSSVILKNQLVDEEGNVVAQPVDIAYHNLLGKGNPLPIASESKLFRDLVSADLVDYGGVYIGENEGVFSTTEIIPIELSLFSEKTFIIENTHDVGISVSPHYFKNNNAVTSSNMESESIYSPDYINVGAGATVIMTSSSQPHLSEPFVALGFIVHRNAIPTTGDFKIYGFGR